MEVYRQLVYEFARTTLGPFVARAMRLKCEGSDNIPAEGRALIVANHRNPILDPVAIALRVARPINFVTAAYAFKVPVIKHAFSSVGAFPLDVLGGKKSQEGLEYAVNLLEQDELVGIFPEGMHTIAHLHSVSKIRTFRTGFARIALKGRAPIIPAAVIGKERSLPGIPAFLWNPYVDHPEFENGMEVIYYRKALVRIGRPLDLGEFYDQEISKKVIDHVSGKVRRIISKLYDGEDLDRFLTGEKPFDIVTDRV